MNLIEEVPRDNKCFTVVIAYAEFDSHGDKKGYPDDEPDVWKIMVHAADNIQAITRAMHIVMSAKAEIMTNFMGGYPDKDKTFTLDEIEAIRQHAEDTGTFRHWLEIEPTSIQCHLTEDEGKLLDMTTTNINHMIENIGDQADDFLQNIERND
tara:strand:+ start:1758 stop:2216 length:459 start_codon:yes stop_codon:yes gene_type:complete